MKKLLACLFALCLTLCCATAVFADDDLRTDIYRVNDYYGWLTDDEVDALDEIYVDFARTYRMDLSVCVLEERSQDFSTLADFNEWFYDHNGFGYGDTHDGLLLTLDFGGGELELDAYGQAQQVFNSATLDELSTRVVNWIQSGEDHARTLQYFCSAVEEKLGGQPIGGETEPGIQPVTDPATEPVSGGQPDWYPDSISDFQRFHNESAPRVVDTADIFTPAQEAAMAEKIAAIREKTGYDLVVFTDVSTYGLSKAVYAADYYYFNGYGYDDQYSGSILFICMEQGNRGWWTAATGECQPIYTERTVNDLDDRLEPYMIAGRDSGNANHEYGEGVLDYLDNVDALYYKPDWMPEDTSTFARFHNEASVSRVIDNANMLTPGEKEELEQQIAALREKYGADTVILTERQTYHNGSIYDHARAFYTYNGYGVGPDYQGVILCIRQRQPGGPVGYSVSIQGYGDQGENEERLLDRLEKFLGDSRPDGAGAAGRFLHDVEKFYKKGSAPKNYNFTLPALMAAIAGSLSGLVTSGVQRGKMKSIGAASEATEYVVPGSFRRKELGDMVIATHVTQTARAERDHDSGGGGSSYSGGYSSSGGGSFSGGGRDF